MRKKTCAHCGARIHERRTTLQRPYRYTLSGLDNLYLAGIVVRTCRQCGTEVPVIPKLGELHVVVARDLLRKPVRLTGGEVRFLRKNAGIASAMFAKMLGVDPAHLSRFENGSTEWLGPSTDKLARAVAGAAMNMPEELRQLLIDAARKLDVGRRKRTERPTFKLEHDQWRAA